MLKDKKAFTIVELVVVIVVIAILASVTALTYVGVRDRALNASLKSDLYSAYNSLKQYQAENDIYPLAVDDCPTPSAGNICVGTSDENSYFDEYAVDNTADTPTFSLKIKSSIIGTIFIVTQDTVPVEFTEPEPTWIQVAAGTHFTCALRSNSEIYCVGLGTSGQLGNGTIVSSSVPVKVDNTGVLAGKTITSIEAGTSFMSALDSDGAIYTWGLNTNGQLGNGSTTNSSVPVAVDMTGVLSGKVITQISAGGDHMLAVDSAGKVYSWGYNYWGQLGDNSASQRTTPVAVYTGGILSGKTIISASAGNQFSIVAASNGYVYSWGYNATGQLGNPVTTRSVIPVQTTSTGVLSGKTIVMVAAGGAYTSVLDSNGKVYSWGTGSYGQLGNNNNANSMAPVSVYTAGALNGVVISKIYACAYHMIAIDSNGIIYSWGYDSNGQLGNNSTSNSLVPVVVRNSGVLSGKLLINAAGSSDHSIALSDDGQIFGWGLGSNGDLGNSLTATSLVPLLSSSFMEL